ncbi:MAG TPA: hypothetical protein VI455_20235 [Terriglobia bacterium]
MKSSGNFGVQPNHLTHADGGYLDEWAASKAVTGIPRLLSSTLALGTPQGSN